MPAEALRHILAFSDQAHAWHDEQCTSTELCAYIAVDAVAHIELAAEARVKPLKKQDDAEVDEDTDSEAEAADRNRRNFVELVDMGGGGDDEMAE